MGGCDGGVHGGWGGVYFYASKLGDQGYQSIRGIFPF